MGFGAARDTVTASLALPGTLRAALCAALVLAGCDAGPQKVPRAPALPAVADLAAAERLGGHTLARHVGRTDDDLRERLRREPSIAAASTYPDRQTAERVVAAALERFSGRIAGWSAPGGPRPNLALDYRGEAGKSVGRSLRRGDTRVRSCPDAIVVLRWHPDVRYYVLTSYPECRQ